MSEEQLQHEIAKRDELILALLRRFNILGYQALFATKSGPYTIDVLHNMHVNGDLSEPELQILKTWKK